VEKFLIARRLMYWQVYLHKTVLSAENMLIMLLKKAKELTLSGERLFAAPSFEYFLNRSFKPDDLLDGSVHRDNIIKNFILLDDNDVISAIKVWMEHRDPVLSELSRAMINRNLFKVELQNQAFSTERILLLKQKAMQLFSISEKETSFFVFSDSVSNHTYIPTNDDQIKIRYSNGAISDIAEASDMLNISVLSKVIEKHFLCYPKALK